MISTSKPPSQLLKWIGNKQRFAPSIISYFPETYGTYFEPFLGSGAVLGGLSPHCGHASDVLEPLIEIWEMVKSSPDEIVAAYDRYNSMLERGKDKKEVYQLALDRFNTSRRPEEFIFLSRSCYGGVIRFRKADGFMSTPVGPHKPISTESFERRVHAWNQRIQHTTFAVADYKDSFARAQSGDLIYCDPPYVDTQKILYGAQAFSFPELIEQIREAKNRGVKVALSIDGSKKSGAHQIDLPIPADLFEVEVSISVGKSMLKRFQVAGSDVASEGVADRLLLTYEPDAATTLF